MSVIDKAFVKAYARRTQVSPTSDPLPQAPSSIASPPDVSINPKSEESAIVWVDAVADQYLRRDDSHELPTPQLRTRAGSPEADGQSAAGGHVRARGSRPVVQPQADLRPAVVADRTPSQASAMSDTRLDAGHRVAAPIAIPVSTPEQSKPVPSGFGSNLNIQTAPGVEPLQFATLPWIEASSTLVETPLHQAVTGPYYSDSVIIQENYLPTPMAAPPKPVAPVQHVAAPVQHVAAPTKPATQPVAQPFAAVWEVDAFEFSDTMIGLFGDAGLIKSIGFPLDRAVSEGLQTLLITSVEQGAGRTTVATGIAIAAATAGLRVALVDATIATALASTSAAGSSLADALNLEIQFGWIEAIRGGISIAETAIHSIEDQLTVLPLVVPRAGLPPTSDEFARVIQTLRQAFDLIVIDGPPCTEAAFRPLVSHGASAAAVDATILVQDMRQASADQADRVMEMLRRDGITGLGMVQNFV